MKDYSWCILDKNNYILNYRLNENMIIVKYASGEERTYDYHEELVYNIINQMEKQALNARPRSFLMIKNIWDKKDIERMNYYLKNKELIQYKIDYFINSIIENNLSKKALKEINNNNSVSLNNIECFTLNDLKNIRETIVNEDYEEGDDEDIIIDYHPKLIKAYYSKKTTLK